MVAMATKSSSIKRERLALELAVERFRSSAVSEFWDLMDRLPQGDSVRTSGASRGPEISVNAWEQARQRHHLALQGLIPWPADLVPSVGPATVPCGEQREPEPSDWSAQPRAA
jgi:hypothetical protein